MTVDYIPPQKSYSNGKLSIDKLDLPEAHIIHGREFPVAYALNLNDHEYNRDEVEEFLTSLSQKGVITQLIENHGVFVLRDSVENSDESKAAEVASIIRHIEEGRNQVQFEQNGTLTTRDKKGFNLYTANKSPPESVILQHNEFSRFKRYPNSLVFSILEYTATGGETPLVHGGELYEKVAKELPQFLEKLSQTGLQFNNEIWYKDESERAYWNHEVTFGRNIKPEDDFETKKKKALKIAHEYISDNAWFDEDDNLLASSKTWPVKTFKDEPLLFSSIAAFSDKYTTDEPKIKYGDGTVFSKEDLNKYKKITEELEYKHNWKSGDIVFIHNYQVSHGKLPYKDGKRSTLVGMWDVQDHTKQPFKNFQVEKSDLESVNSNLEALKV
ncbi:Clavaminate synthase protein [Wickerhamomyces ciferrii]|uniref:Clavaminate synthase protein n=1 Tax=Wickerhamomyces ciferrii (strain ATCC 14091 / BCRC 22168 / CBS 111 / JCM 3599 / NBRC 0793 / NRRL Y-1031 F-60-10) TaxID=1206466 RepID=K0KG80_WICCF|nr:Clavaminate synthase protein [Wickerhamomyces ciferrii]CCH44165.1 Clavaminate synthase protein [Wickerhamomyces ciferrii]